MRVGYNGVNNAPARRLDNLAQNSDVPPDVTVVTDQGQMEGGADRASRSVHQKAVGVEDIEISVASGAVEQGDISADRAVNVKGVSHADGDGDGPALAVKRAKSNGDGDDIPRTSARGLPGPCGLDGEGEGHGEGGGASDMPPISPLKRSTAALNNDILVKSDAFDIEHDEYNPVESLLEQALKDTRFVFVEVWTVNSKSVQAAAAQVSARADKVRHPERSRHLSVTNHMGHMASPNPQSGGVARAGESGMQAVDVSAGACASGGDGMEPLSGGASGGGDEPSHPHKVHKMGRKTRRKVRETLKTAARPLIKNMVGAKTSLIVFTGTSKIKKSFLKMSGEIGSFYDAKNVAVMEHIVFLEKLGLATSYKQGEGLPGMAWSRGLKGEAEWNILEDLFNDPEMVFNERLAATVPLFHSSIGVPVFDLANPKVVTNILLFYLPHELKTSPGKQIEYLDSKTNPKLDVYLKQVASTFAIATQWQSKARRWGNVRSYIQNPTSKRVEQLWRKVRVTVMTGLMRQNVTSKQQTKWQRRFHRLSGWAARASSAYFTKWKGKNTKRPPPGEWNDSLFSSVCAFLGLLIIAYLHDMYEDEGLYFLLGSFGATATIIFSIPFVNYAQPRNIIVSHIIAGVLSVSVNYLTHDDNGGIAVLPHWFAEALVTSMIIFSIAYLGFIHPPSAACGLIYIRGDQAIKDMFWLYLIVPSLVGCGILIAIGVILNNLKKDRRYPLYW